MCVRQHLNLLSICGFGIILPNAFNSTAKRSPFRGHHCIQKASHVAYLLLVDSTFEYHSSAKHSTLTTYTSGWNMRSSKQLYLLVPRLNQLPCERSNDGSRHFRNTSKRQERTLCVLVITCAWPPPPQAHSNPFAIA